MAMVNESDRGLCQFDFSKANLSPGMYYAQDIKDQDENQKKQQNYSPFNTSSNKYKDINKHQQNVPGPGQYEINNKITVDVVRMIPHQQTLIIKMSNTGTSSFKSTQKRFEEQQESNLPGPGEYFTQNNLNGILNSTSSQSPKSAHSLLHSDKEQNTQPASKTMLQKIKSENNMKKVASIPHKIIKIYHDKNQENIDITKMEENKIFTMQTLGPGQYHLKDTFTLNQHKGYTWGKNKEKRFYNQTQEEQNIGPGSYQDKGISVKNKGKLDPSYTSETTKSFWDNILYNTNSDIKASLRNEMHYKESEQPAPNQYFAENVINSIKVQYKHPIFQFFGSTSPRFIDKKAEFQVSPGQYEQQSNLQNSDKRRNLHAFNQSSSRDDVNLRHAMNQNPGPGSYKIDNIVSMENKLVKKIKAGYKVGKFGSNEKRFQTPPARQVTPGPGQYTIQNLSQDKIQSATYQNSFFKSQSPRHLFKDRDHSSPSANKYDQGLFSIQKNLDNQKKQIDRLKKIDVTKPPFNQSSNRFNHYDSSKEIKLKQNKNHSEEYGRFQSDQSAQEARERQRDLRIKAAQKMNQVEFPPFLFKSNKDDYHNNQQENPGVGKYNICKDQWNNRSFNIKYQQSKIVH